MMLIYWALVAGVCGFVGGLGASLGVMVGIFLALNWKDFSDRQDERAAQSTS